MTRVTNSPVKKARHNKVLARTSGFRMTKNRLYKVAHEAYLHALSYSFAGRKNRKRDMRSLWNTRINAALRTLDEKYGYSRFFHDTTTKQMLLDRKTLSALAASDPSTFKKIVETVRS